MRTLSTLLILIGALALSACDKAEETAVRKFVEKQLEAKEKAEEVLQQAKEVEGLLQDTAEKRMKQIDGSY